MLAQWRQTQQYCCDGNLFARKLSTSLARGCLARRHARQDLDQRHPHQLGECHKNLANHLFSIDALHTLFYGWRSASLHCRLKRYQQPDSSLELIFTPFAPSPPQYSCKPLHLLLLLLLLLRLLLLTCCCLFQLSPAVSSLFFGRLSEEILFGNQNQEKDGDGELVEWAIGMNNQS